MADRPPVNVVVLMPVRDDWTSAAELIRQIDKTIPSDACALDIVMVDDGSAQPCTPADFQGNFSAVRAISALRLCSNVGHQRAIAIGLAHLHNSKNCDAVVVMDADGEDTPQGMAQLLRAYSENRGSEAIFAERSRRSESLVFRVFYQIFKILHRGLTGISVRVGNFSILPFPYLDTLVVRSELWNHYAATVFRSRLAFSMVRIPRGSRIAGTTRMNFVSLVTHGLSAISVFGDIVGVRIMIWALAGSVLAVLGMIAVVLIRLFTSSAIPGWATYAAGILAIVMMQLITIAASFTFFMLANRTNLGFVPVRDYRIFVKKEVGIYPNE